MRCTRFCARPRPGQKPPLQSAHASPDPAACTGANRWRLPSQAPSVPQSKAKESAGTMSDVLSPKARRADGATRHRLAGDALRRRLAADQPAVGSTSTATTSSRHLRAPCQGSQHAPAIHRVAVSVIDPDDPYNVVAFRRHIVDIAREGAAPTPHAGPGSISGRTHPGHAERPGIASSSACVFGPHRRPGLTERRPERAGGRGRIRVTSGASRSRADPTTALAFSRATEAAARRPTGSTTRTSTSTTSRRR